MPCSCKTKQVALGNTTIETLVALGTTLTSILAALVPGKTLTITSTLESSGSGTVSGTGLRRVTFTAIGGASNVNGVELTSASITFEKKFPGDVLPNIAWAWTSGTLRIDKEVEA